MKSDFLTGNAQQVFGNWPEAARGAYIAPRSQDLLAGFKEGTLQKRTGKGGQEREKGGGEERGKIIPTTNSWTDHCIGSYVSN